ncbi:MAG TPA: winged helix-turn-helix domain-containing protein [Candidatus Methanoperedens sp.]
MRHKIDIIIEILEIAEKGINKTRIVYGANLNFKLAEKYLALLIQNGLMKKNQDKFVTSEKGRIVLEKAKEISMLLDKNG